MKTKVFEQGDRYFFLGPVSPITPGASEVEEFAFAEQIKKMAPNENILWMRGQYVEADTPNANRQQWTSEEIALKHLTPVFMPVTVMHDTRTAVGLIADTSLLLPDADNVPNPRIDTTLGLWAHRFPEACEEAMENYRQGTLMQSMEAVSPHYSCSECGQVFHKLPDGSERANWCSHLKGENGEKAARILGNVTFTGTGLIFGTRDGARGANGKAYLELSAEELANWHEEAHAATRTSRRTGKDRKVSKVETKEISLHEYETLKAESAELAKLKAELAAAEQAKAEAEKKVEETEAAKVKVEEELASTKKEKEELEESARRAELAGERMSKLGKGFTGRLGEFTAERLRKDAETLDEEAWENRLKELEEMSGFKRDAPAEGGDNPKKESSKPETSVFTSEELARAGVGANNNRGDSHEPSLGERTSVVGKLLAGKK